MIYDLCMDIIKIKSEMNNIDKAREKLDIAYNICMENHAYGAVNNIKRADYMLYDESIKKLRELESVLDKKYKEENKI